MITRSMLYSRLKKQLGSKLLRLISEDLINEVLNMETLPTFSDYYPLLVSMKIKASDAIQYTDYNGYKNGYTLYRIPNISSSNGFYQSQNDDYVWIDIENYYMTGNDYSDVYTGGNLLLNQFFLSANANIPHTRSYYILTFQEPNTLVVDPPQMIHRDFTVIMKAVHKLHTVPRNMREIFLSLFVADCKIYLYNEYANEEGSQVYGGIEIDTKLDRLSNGEDERKEVIEIMEADWMLNPERFEVINLYQTKG